MDPASLAKTAAPLPEVARLVLSIGRMLLEFGSDARTVHQAIFTTARGLGCDSAESFCQHAAIIVMLRRGEESCAQMGKVGEHGVNLQRAQAVQHITASVGRGELSCAAALSQLEAVPSTTPAYPKWLICLATGLACGAFGRLLHADWASFLPTTIGAGVGQWLRMFLMHRHNNLFITWGIVSFVAALLGGLGARVLACEKVEIAMAASVLLLVPGVAVLNAQVDILDGKPNLGAARALRVAYMLLFMTLGLALAQRVVVGMP